MIARLTELPKEAQARHAHFVVFPELLALTTFFTRYWMTDEAEIDRYFESSMPNADVQPLFDLARQYGIGFYLGYAELTPQRERFNTAIIVDRKGLTVGRYRKAHLPGHDDHKPTAPFQHLEKKYFHVGNEGFKVWETMGTRMGMCICNDRRWLSLKANGRRRAPLA